MGLLTILGALTDVVPSLVHAFAGDKAGEVADKTADVVKTITGQSDPQKAVDAIKADPKLQLEFQKAMQPVLLAHFQAETQRLQTVNETMRAEYASKDAYVRRARPTYLYLMAVTWFIQMTAFSFVLGYTMIEAPDKLPQIITALTSIFGALFGLWGIALSVVGVYVKKRSDDKQLAAGKTPAPGIMAALAQRIKGKLANAG